MLTGTIGILVPILAGVLLLLAKAKNITLSLFVAVSVSFVNVGFLVNYVDQGGGDSSDAATGVHVVSIGLLSVVLGGLSATRMRAAPRAAIARVRLSSGAELAAVSLVVLLPSWLYFVLLGNVPLFDSVSAIATRGVDGLGVLNNSRLLRDAYVTGTGTRVPLQGLLEVFRNLGVPVLFAVTLAQLRSGLPRRPRIALMAVCAITVIAAGQKWPLMYLVAAGLAVTYIDGRPRRRGLSRRIVIWGTISGLVLSLMQARSFSTRSVDFLESVQLAFQDLVVRITQGQVVIPIQSYEVHSPLLQWQLGNTYILNLLSYLPGPGATYPVEFYKIVSGDSLGYTAPPDFYTEAYINFSFPGVAIIGFLWGLVIVHITSNAVDSRDWHLLGLRAGLITALAFSAISGVSYPLAFIFVALAVVAGRLVLTYISGKRTLQEGRGGAPYPLRPNADHIGSHPSVSARSRDSQSGTLRQG